MFVPGQKHDSTIAVYNSDATRFLAMFMRMQGEKPIPGSTDRYCDFPYEHPIGPAIRWFTGRHKIWSKPHIARTALALAQLVELLVAIDELAAETGESYLDKLRNERPDHAPVRKKKGYRKSISNRNLRRLVAYFRGRGDEFARWIADYIIIASRIGWRPGEIVNLRLEGRVLSANAEKKTNDRGLFDTCEVILAAYPERISRALSLWIDRLKHWVNFYRGEGRLMDVINGRIRTACKKLRIPVINTYTLRHVAIACMKKSGFTRAEIAVLVNHASSRTATERYGKARSGVKRPKKMLGYDPSRLDRVRDNARAYPAARKIKKKR